MIDGRAGSAASLMTITATWRPWRRAVYHRENTWALAARALRRIVSGSREDFGQLVPVLGQQVRVSFPDVPLSLVGQFDFRAKPGTREVARHGAAVARPAGSSSSIGSAWKSVDLSAPPATVRRPTVPTYRQSRHAPRSRNRYTDNGRRPDGQPTLPGRSAVNSGCRFAVPEGLAVPGAGGGRAPQLLAACRLICIGSATLAPAPGEHYSPGTMALRTEKCGGAAVGPRSQVPERRPRVALAQGLPGHAFLSGAGHESSPPAPPARDRAPENRHGRRAPRRDRQASDSTHAPPFVRDASARRRSRHPDGAGAPGPPRREHEADLHPRAEPWSIGGAEPSRHDVGSVRNAVAA